MNKDNSKKLKIIQYVFLAFSWGSILIMFLKLHGHFTLDNLLALSPINKLGALAFLVWLFLVKGGDFTLYIALLYAAAGLLFPMPIALLVSFCGTLITLTSGYLIGRLSGRDIALSLISRYPKLEKVLELKQGTDFTVILLMRLVGIPMTVVSIYAGAAEIKYTNFVAASILGLLIDIVAFTTLGTGVKDPGSRYYFIFLGLKVCMVIAAFIVSARLLKKHSNSSN